MIQQKLECISCEILSACLSLTWQEALLRGREWTVARQFTTAGINPCSLFIQIYGESSSCAGRALRNIFTLQASDLIKDRVDVLLIFRRSCVGSELVDWLLEQCPFVKCRSTAVGVWQLLLDMGIILSVDRQLYFQDNHTFYQFSADECTYLFCEFEKEEAWKNGVKLLLQLLPLSPPRIDICISFKVEICGSVMSWDCGFKYLFALSPTLKAGVLCKLQGRDDIGRIELVQKLARENCQFLQADRKALEKAEQVRHFLFGFFCFFLGGEGDLVTLKKAAFCLILLKALIQMLITGLKMH
uniref:DEP domain-containing protein n=1 Tax=Malurus cyaneus samueli TaxID=2593467 RepID=A0A8C5TVW5_9PASS